MSKPKVVVILMVFAFSLLSVAQNAKPEFSLAVSAPLSVKAGSPILLEITVTNVSNHKIAFDTDVPIYVERSFDIRVMDSSGKPVHATPYMLAVRGEHDERPGATIVVEPTTVWGDPQPGEIMKHSADLKKLFEFKPGKYTVQVSRNDYFQRRISTPNPECWVEMPGFNYRLSFFNRYVVPTSIRPEYCYHLTPITPQVKAVAKSNIVTFTIVP